MARYVGNFQSMFKTKMRRLAPLVAILITTSSCAITQHVNGTDMKCPSSPKCVSSEERNTPRFIEPFSFDDQPKQAMKRLKVALLEEDHVTITHEESTSLLAEVRSQIFGFVDDVKFVLLPEQGTIQVRSSARTGYSDLGVNRRRIERIRRVFEDSKSI